MVYRFQHDSMRLGHNAMRRLYACLGVCLGFQVSTDIIHFLSKKLHYYKGDYDTFVNVRTELAKNQRRAYEASAAKKQHMQEFIDKFRSNAKRASLVQSRIKVRLFAFCVCVCVFFSLPPTSSAPITMIPICPEI